MDDLSNQFSEALKLQNAIDPPEKPYESKYKARKRAKAVKRNRIDVVSLLIQEGADVNKQSQLNETALMEAAYYGNAKIVNLLIDNGADVDMQDKYGYTALMVAAVEGNAKIVTLLIDNGADVDMQDKYNYTCT